MLPTPKVPPTTTIVAVVGVVCSSFFTYLSSRAEAEAAKLQNAAGYEAMQAAVKGLQDATYASALVVAKMEGRLDTLEARSNARQMRSPGRSIEPTAAELALMPDAGVAEPVPVKLAPPPSLGQALEQFKEKH